MLSVGRGCAIFSVLVIVGCAFEGFSSASSADCVSSASSADCDKSVGIEIGVGALPPSLFWFERESSSNNRSERPAISEGSNLSGGGESLRASEAGLFNAPPVSQRAFAGELLLSSESFSSSDGLRMRSYSAFNSSPDSFDISFSPSCSISFEDPGLSHSDAGTTADAGNHPVRPPTLPNHHGPRWLECASTFAPVMKDNWPLDGSPSNVIRATWCICVSSSPSSSSIGVDDTTSLGVAGGSDSEGDSTSVSSFMSEITAGSSYSTLDSTSPLSTSTSLESGSFSASGDPWSISFSSASISGLCDVAASGWGEIRGSLVEETDVKQPLSSSSIFGSTFEVSVTLDNFIPPSVSSSGIESNDLFGWISISSSSSSS